ncbi:hypothetical protein LOAG_03936 [Loa loa]|uniref:Uncharacterized protein n=1 Tax=Loa loa TaxID=7209 RepID=A0A1S0U3H6_LOALO|nr:hypothetical protein LOAG_03936 [Loa loa]EFO24555.1 hypothetical protein LOAG_03936 [Loa loa]
MVRDERRVPFQGNGSRSMADGSSRLSRLFFDGLFWLTKNSGEKPGEKESRKLRRQYWKLLPSQEEQERAGGSSFWKFHLDININKLAVTASTRFFHLEITRLIANGASTTIYSVNSDCGGRREISSHGAASL